MPAIVSDRDLICLQCLKIYKHLQSDRARLKSHLKNFSTIAGILGPCQIRLQAYMVPNATDIAGIAGIPLLNQYCRHNGPPDTINR